MWDFFSSQSPAWWDHLSTEVSSLIPVKRHCLGCHCQGFGSSGGGTGCPVRERSGAAPCWSQLIQSSSIMSGTNPPHTSAAASQRGPGPAAPAGLREGGTTGVGGSGGDTWGHKREETRGDTGGDVRMHKRRHRKVHSSRYRRRHVEGDRAGNGSWREGLHAGGNLGRGLCLWGTHTGAGTPPKGQQPMDDPGWSVVLVRRKEQGKKRAKEQEWHQESNLLHCPSPHPRDWQGLNVIQTQ